MLAGIIIADIANLFIFKYANLAVDSTNSLNDYFGFFDESLMNLDMVLPLAISFYTFQMISYLVDVYRHEAREATNAIDFLYYVTFFPQLIAGPIVRPKEFFPQYCHKKLDFENLSTGFRIFTIGLFQKAVIGDNLAMVVDHGYKNVEQLSNYDLYIVLVAYSFQIFFDFAGYSNMAIGSARMFGYKLPENFNTPYIAENISQFWRRWHMTLSRWIMDYIFIPLGGSRGTLVKTCKNLLITMALGGLWHGAAWTFVVWGIFHGMGLVLHRLYGASGLQSKFSSLMPAKIYHWLMVFVTFQFVTIGWIFFRSQDFSTAWLILAKLFDPQGWLTISVDQALLLKSYGFSAMLLYGVYVVITKLPQVTCYLQHRLYRPVVLYFFIYYFVIFLAPKNADPFIYFQF